MRGGGIQTSEGVVYEAVRQTWNAVLVLGAPGSACLHRVSEMEVDVGAAAE